MRLHLCVEAVDALLHLPPTLLILLRLLCHGVEHEQGLLGRFGFDFRSRGDHSSNSANHEWIYRSSRFHERFRLTWIQLTTLMEFYNEIKGEQIWCHGLPEDRVSLIPPVIPRCSPATNRQCEEVTVPPEHLASRGRRRNRIWGYVFHYRSRWNPATFSTNPSWADSTHTYKAQWAYSRHVVDLPNAAPCAIP
jgi:hypothetical protein